MNDWKEVRLGDLVSIQSGFAYKSQFIGEGSNYLLGMGCVSFKEKFLHSGARPYCGDFPDRFIVKPGELVLATRQQSDNLPILAMPAIVPDGYNGKLFIGANLYKVVNNSNVSNDFIYWLMKTPMYVNYIKEVKTGSVVSMVTKANVENFTFKCPSKDKRERILAIITSLDAKIENNNKINAKLEEIAQNLFKEWFVDFGPFKDGKFVESELGLIPEGWRISSLSKIAEYKNGLAMQKFAPLPGEQTLPVLKIKELGMGECNDNSDLCSVERIGKEFIIDDGDVIFSWSGTLLVDIWVGGKCGLNQHLFKVSSQNFSKAFYFLWTKHHLNKFINVAKDKAVTMGHIKRDELDKAKVLIPEEKFLAIYDKLMSPIIDKIIAIRKESKRLSTLRDTLLPKLMSGEIEV